MKKFAFLIFVCSFGLAGTLSTSTDAVYSQEKAASKDLKWQSRLVQTAEVNSRLAPVITKVAVRPGQLQAISVGDDHIANLINLNTGRIAQSMKGHSSWVRSAKFSPNGKHVFTAGADRKVIRWDLQSDTWQTFCQHPKAVESIDISPDGKLLVAVGFENQIRIYDIDTSFKIFEGKTPCNDMRIVKFSPSGNLIATAGRCGTVAFLKRRVRNGQQNWSHQKSFKVDQRRIHTLEFLDENTIVTGSESRKINQFDLSTEKVTTIAKVSGEIFDIKPIKTHWLAVSGSNNHIDILDRKTGKSVGSLVGHTGTVSCLAKGNGKLISGSYDTQLRLWTIPAGAGDKITQSLPATFNVGEIKRTASLPAASTNTLLPIKRK